MNIFRTACFIILSSGTRTGARKNDNRQRHRGHHYAKSSKHAKSAKSSKSSKSSKGSGRYLHADNMDRYPGYTGSIDIDGHITVSFPQQEEMYFSYDLQGLEPGCIDCGVHIHSGTTCDDAAEVGGHYFSTETEDPWTTDGGATYNADENGTAKGSFSVSSGFDTLRANENHAVVVHGQDGTRLSCGILEVKRWR